MFYVSNPNRYKNCDKLQETKKPALNYIKNLTLTPVKKNRIKIVISVSEAISLYTFKIILLFRSNEEHKLLQFIAKSKTQTQFEFI